MQQLDLHVRYFQDSTPLGVPCREENFVRRQIRMSLPQAQTALVLVDMWNDHFNDSWLERAAHLTRAAVVPVLEAVRGAAMAGGGFPRPPGGLCRLPGTAPPAAWYRPPLESAPRPLGYVAGHRGPRR